MKENGLFRYVCKVWFFGFVDIEEWWLELVVISFIYWLWRKLEIDWNNVLLIILNDFWMDYRELSVGGYLFL